MLGSQVLLLLVTGAFSAVMLLVLLPLRRAQVRGVREWFAANAAATLALPLFAARDLAPDFLSVEVANALLLGANALMLAGYRRRFGLPLPHRVLWVGWATTLALVMLFHYPYPNFAARVVVVSVFHVLSCLAIGLTVIRVPATPGSRYPHRFAAYAAFALAFGHLARLSVYAMKVHDEAGLLDVTFLNLVFLAIGTLALPVLTIGAVMIVNDDLVARAVDMANRDFLTNAWSRRAFFEIAERERLRALRTGRPLSLLVFDVDHFKAINDNYGHHVGDQVLIDLVRRAQSVIRGIDYCARLGGEEFAIILPDAGSAQSQAIAERLRKEIMRQTGQGAGPVCTISAGIASLHAPSETVVELLRRADAALYAAKAGGRNAVVDAEESGCAALQSSPGAQGFRA